MTPDAFDQKIQALQKRLHLLQQQTSAASASQSSPEPLEELAVALEELSVSQTELCQQQDELLRAQRALETERQRYRGLFEFAPDGYLVTDTNGIIREANQAVMTLLHVAQSFLVGKPLSVFVVRNDHGPLRTLLLQLPTSKQKRQELEMHVQPRKGAPFPAAFTMAPVCNPRGNVASIRWLLRDITTQKRLEQELRTLNVELERQVLERTDELTKANQALASKVADHRQDKERLREREALLNAILQTTQAVIYLLDTDGRYVYVNRRFEELFQVQNEAVRGKSVHEIFPPAVAAVFEANNHATITSGKLLETEETVPCPDGQSRVYHSLKAPLRDVTGALRGIVGVATDITARKRAAEALRKSEAKVAAAFQVSPYAAIIMTLSEGRYLEVNEHFLRTFDFRREDVLGRTSRELGVWLDPAVRDRALAIVRAHGVVHDLEMPYRIARGEQRILLTSAALIEEQAQACLLVVGTDITERKRREANAAFLAEIQDDFAHLTSADEIMQTVGAKLGAFLHVATAYLADIDDERDEARLHCIWKTGNAPKVPAVTRLSDFLIADFTRAARAGETFVIRDTETDPRTNSATYRAIKMRSALGMPFPRDGAWKFILAIADSRPRSWRDDEIELFREVANRLFPRLERARAEEALRYSEERHRRLAHEREQQLIQSDRRISFGELTASLAHEFNNPLGIILGFAQDLLKDVTSDHPFHHSLQIIESEVQRCRRLMERLRDFARPAPMQLRWIDPADIIRTSLDLVASQCRKQQVVPRCEFPLTLPRIYADPQQFQQVLLNLFFNALEAMPSEGTLTIRVMVTPSPAPARDELNVENVAIMVTDTGTGIAAGHLGKIFRPFFTTKTKEGMGLGLSICESIVIAHGGRITVDSRVGHGTTFSLFFPVTV